MSREIKFRAWDKTTKKIYEVYSINFENKDLCLKIDDNKIVGANFFEVELMQYTGLKDKNGREIYEGDVLENSYKSNLNNDFEKQIYLIDKSDLGFYFKKLFYGVALKFTLSTLEVIGNIYENPELLMRKG